LFNDIIFIFLWIHKGQGVVVLHYDKADPPAPQAKHGSVYNVCEGSLRVICNSLPEGRCFSSTTEEPPLSSSECDKITHSSKLVISPSVPSKMCWKCLEVLGLKAHDDWLGEVGLLCEGRGLTSIVRSVSQFLAHETVRVVSVEGPFGDIFIAFKVARPSKVRPT
jgi:hypothetical protein